MKPRSHPSHGHRQGFTLIELLVVIAIISVLAAILFPAFASAREKARQIACLSNEKQMGLAVMQYAQDNDEAIVPYAMEDGLHDDDSNTAPKRVWSGLLQPYISNGQNNSTVSNVTNSSASGIFQCPSFNYAKLSQAADGADCDGNGQPGSGQFGQVSFSFADYGISIPWGANNGSVNPAPYNNFAGSGRDPLSQASPQPYINQTLAAIHRPAETAFIGDGWTGYAQGSTQYQIVFGCESSHMHQDMGSNFVFLDGHAKFIKGNIFDYTSQDPTVGTYMTYLSYDVG